MQFRLVFDSQRCEVRTGGEISSTADRFKKAEKQSGEAFSRMHNQDIGMVQPGCPRSFGIARMLFGL